MAFNDFTGVPDGVAISTTNSGGAGNNLFDFVNFSSAPSTAVANGSSDHPIHSKNNLKFITDNVNTGSAQIGWNATTFGSITTMYYSAYFYFTSLPSSSNLTLARVTSGGTANLCGTLAVETAGTLGVFQNGGARMAQTTAIETNTWIRINFSITAGNGTANTGSAEVKLFNSAALESTTPTSSATAATFNTSTFTTTDTLRTGQYSALSGASNFYMADLTANGSGYAAPYAVAAADGWTYKRFIRIGT